MTEELSPVQQEAKDQMHANIQQMQELERAGKLMTWDKDRIIAENAKLAEKRWPSATPPGGPQARADISAPAPREIPEAGGTLVRRDTALERFARWLESPAGRFQFNMRMIGADASLLDSRARRLLREVKARDDRARRGVR
jgi:hypothetical protein